MKYLDAFNKDDAKEIIYILPSLWLFKSESENKHIAIPGVDTQHLFLSVSNATKL